MLLQRNDLLEMKEIYLIRHGETEYNRKGIIQGCGVDMPLNHRGVLQADAFYNYYKEINFDVVVHSNLIRSKQTILPFLNDQDLPSIELREIREISWGAYEGKTYTPELRADYATMLKDWSGGKLDSCLAGGESAAELFERVEIGIQTILSLDAQKILVCSHGRTIRAMMCAFQKLDPSHMENYEHSNTGLFLMHHVDSKIKVLTNNDTTHLQEVVI